MIKAGLLLILSLFFHYTYAYITDIKLVSCDDNYACPSYPGYRKILTDLNKGVDDSVPVYLHYKDDPNQDPITDLTIVQGLNHSHIPNISKWIKLNVDLNQRKKSNNETSLWLYYTKDKSVSKNPINSIIIKEGYSPLVSTEYRRIPVDLNQDVGGYHLFMYYSQDGPRGKHKQLAIAMLKF